MGIDMEWMCAYGPCVLIWGGRVHMVEVYKGVFLGKR